MYIPMEELSGFYKEAAEELFGVSANIDDNFIEFNVPEWGDFSINLRETKPQFMRLTGVVYSDFKNKIARQDLLFLCNKVNADFACSMDLAFLTLSEKNNIIRASVGTIMAGPEQMPDADFMVRCLNDAMTYIKNAANALKDELMKLNQ